MQIAWDLLRDKATPTPWGQTCWQTNAESEILHVEALAPKTQTDGSKKGRYTWPLHVLYANIKLKQLGTY